VLTDFGRTPRSNANAGRDHDPDAYTIAFAGGGIQGGQVYGSTDRNGALPETQPFTPPGVHTTIFPQLGIPPKSEIRDMLDRPFPISDGEVLRVS